MAVEETQEPDGQRGPGARITDRIGKFWKQIIEATDEKIDDNNTNNI
ncbi:MAG: hypothetical protein U5L72_07060 [Bacteroidales bacterium]|nr:hypothetical protein [Bacteroidales bacterium]